MPIVTVTLAVEGDGDIAVARRLLHATGLSAGPAYALRGKGRLDENMPRYNNAARWQPWLVIRDLDHDASCAPDLRGSLLSEPAPWMCFRIAVREIEAWLLADHDTLSRYLRVSKAIIPRNPDDLDDPKRELVKLGKRSRLREIRADMAPAHSTSAIVGPGYTARIIEYASKQWRPDVAAGRSDSLKRCLDALERLRDKWLDRG